MKREILFKAKRADGEGWVEGSYVKGRVWKAGEEPKDYCTIHQILLGVHEVDPETVCQYTGLKDKNGVKIFEGDTVLYKETYEEPLEEAVEWAYTHYSFDGDLLCDWNQLIEVTGNIHDK